MLKIMMRKKFESVSIVTPTREQWPCLVCVEHDFTKLIVIASKYSWQIGKHSDLETACGLSYSKLWAYR